MYWRLSLRPIWIQLRRQCLLWYDIYKMLQINQFARKGVSFYSYSLDWNVIWSRIPEFNDYDEQSFRKLWADHDHNWVHDHDYNWGHDPLWNPRGGSMYDWVGWPIYYRRSMWFPWLYVIVSRGWRRGWRIQYNKYYKQIICISIFYSKIYKKLYKINLMIISTYI